MKFLTIKQVHDNFFASTMESRLIATGVARIALPKKIADQIDFNTMELTHDVWVNPKLHVHCGDIVYRAKQLNDQRKWVYILFEHKSGIDPGIPYQNLQYIIEIWAEYRKQHPRSKSPQVLPIIVYHGSKTWVFDNTLKHSCEILKGAEDTVPGYKNYLFDLSVKSTDTHSSKDWRNSDIMTKAFLIALKYSRHRDVLEQVSKIIRMFKGGSLKSKEYLFTLLVYIGSVIPKRMQRDFLLTIEKVHEGGVMYMRSVADSLRMQGWLQGRNEGITIGEKKGKKEGITIGKKEGITIGERMGKKEGIAIGEKTGQRQKDLEHEKQIMQIVRKLLAKGMAAPEIARITNVSVYKVRKLKSEMGSR